MTDFSFRDRVVSVLVGSGYPDYAVRLMGFRAVKETPSDSEFIAHTDYLDLFLPSHLTDNELCLLARHEMLHVLLAHSDRTGDRQQLIWNVACDFEASNYYSAFDELVMRYSEVLRGGCSVVTEPQFGDMTAEEIYDALLAESGDTVASGGLSVGDRAAAFGAGGFSDVFSGSQRELRERMEELGGGLGDADAADDKEDTGHGTGLGGDGREASPPDHISTDLEFDLRAFFRRDRVVQKGRTFRRPNKKYADSGIIMKARSNKYTEGSTLAVYVDVSGSMTQNKVAKALGVLRNARKLKRVSVLEFYFGDYVRDAFFKGDGTNYDKVFQHAELNGYSCIAIITDDSDVRLTKSYRFEAVWIAGIEIGDVDKYGVGQCINAKSGKYYSNYGVSAKHFKVSIVGR